MKLNGTEVMARRQQLLDILSVAVIDILYSTYSTVYKEPVSGEHEAVMWR